MSIARYYTLFTPPEIATIFKTAKRALRHPAFDVLLVPKRHETGRILVIASRKTGNAVVRNRIRRRIKNIFLTEKLYEAGFDCVVIIKPGGAAVDFEAIKALLVATFRPC